MDPDEELDAAVQAEDDADAPDAGDYFHDRIEEAVDYYR